MIQRKLKLCGFVARLLASEHARAQGHQFLGLLSESMCRIAGGDSRRCSGLMSSVGEISHEIVAVLGQHQNSLQMVKDGEREGRARNNTARTPQQASCCNAALSILQSGELIHRAVDDLGMNYSCV
jgi:hypothetical protein